METDHQQVAIVTGAGSGIGRDTAMMLAEHGFETVLVSRTEKNLDETAMLIRQGCEGAEPLVVAADLTEAGAAKRVVEATIDKFGLVDVVCNVAGSAPLLQIGDITPKIWRDCVDINLSAVVMMTQAVWAHFKSRQNGMIVNISSMASIDPFPGFSIYAAAKVGVNMFTKCTADEGAKLGIRAVAIAPGAVETEMLRENFNEKVIPTEKTLDPSVIAGKVLECVTDHESFSSGETIVVANP
ncbi:putative oxidoreductase [Poriferisphaera corsica]|uniref:Putative oxidoreductase n=1 Tax=Poriferisphaera corsica TaxID=2528020 RepID=A0A517YV92_9BACT|nr:SDR family oxidoreductase [Poriferisphaera corsica]QDU34082.1 putative oxidoreductase [Poriferisphaera corsica]